MIVVCARLVLDYEDNERLLAELERRFPPGRDQDRALDYVYALGFMDAELGRAAVERVLVRHKRLAA
jgi:hypothetical protein